MQFENEQNVWSRRRKSWWENFLSVPTKDSNQPTCKTHRDRPILHVMPTSLWRTSLGKTFCCSDTLKKNLVSRFYSRNHDWDFQSWKLFLILQKTTFWMNDRIGPKSNNKVISPNSSQLCCHKSANNIPMFQLSFQLSRYLKMVYN